MLKTLTLVLSCFLITFPLLGKEKDLPLRIEYNGENKTPMIFHITGDGGMVRFDLRMLKEYQNHGFSYVGLNSLKYFISGKTPEKVAEEIIPVIQHYSEIWDKQTLMLVGFSFGAEIIPFLYNRLPPEMKKNVKLVVLLTPARTSQFRIRFRDMVGLDKKKEPYNVAIETAKIKSPGVLAVFGKEEKPSLKESDKQPNLNVELIKGGHGFHDSKEVFRLIKNEFESTKDRNSVSSF